jgi:hypothetical protein
MGYLFEFEKRAAKGIYELNDWQMGLVREVLREVGAGSEPGVKQALAAKGFAPTSESVSMNKFKSNDNWHVTPLECRFIAKRLRRGIVESVHAELMLLYDDAPSDEEMGRWLDEFASFNERASEHGGYRVR